LREDGEAVTDQERPNEVLGALPHTRPHRRSDKRKPVAAKATAAKPKPTTVKSKPTAATSKPKAVKPKTAKPRIAQPKTSATAKPKTSAPAKTASIANAKPAARLRQPAQPAGTPPRGPSSARVPARPPTTPPRRAGPPTGGEILSTAVQAAAELAEIGLTASARALRNALSRLPRP
jgi:hypothetical protein